MAFCNIMSGRGFGTEFFGPLGMVWLGMVGLFFIIVLSRKWLGEEMGISFSTAGAFIGGYLPYIILATITCQFKWAFVAGIIGFIIGAYLGGMFTGGEY